MEGFDHGKIVFDNKPHDLMFSVEVCQIMID